MLYRSARYAGYRFYSPKALFIQPFQQIMNYAERCKLFPQTPLGEIKFLGKKIQFRYTFLFRKKRFTDSDAKWLDMGMDDAADVVEFFNTFKEFECE